MSYDIWTQGKVSTQIHQGFEILEKIGHFTCKNLLSPNMSNIHNVFHVLLQKRYVGVESHILDLKENQVEENLTNAEQLLRILDQKDKILKNKTIYLVLVQLQHRETEKATWEL